MENRDARRVGRWFERHGARFGLAGRAVHCTPVLNLGGFVNRSFHVHDDRLHLHVKLLDGESAPERWRWLEVRRHLEQHYHAPRLIGVVEGGVIADEALALIFEYVPGRPLDPRYDVATTAAVLEAAVALHGDAVVHAALGPAPDRTCADEIVDTYVERLRADLDEIEPAQGGMPFLAAGFCGWARAEVEEIADTARGAGEFAAPASGVVHGDLHGGNVLVADAGHWWLLDWDDLHPGGDPAVDVCVLLWPLIRAGDGRELLRAHGDAGMLSRLPLYRRAMLLDEVVDSLADWVEADALPEHSDLVRRLKRTQHEEALALYSQEYESGPG